MIITILVIAAATLLTRFLPFILFSEEKKTPKFISYLSGVLPFAVLGILVIYCLKDVRLFSTDAFAHLLAIAFITLLHIWKRSVLLSILGGTLCYMVILQLIERVFIF